MPWNLDSRFETPINADVVRFVQRTQPSAHSDVSEELYRAIDGIPGAALYSPDETRYAWVIAHTPDDCVFAMAYGMRGFALRVGPDAVAEAIVDGAERRPEIGPGWVAFDPFLVEVRTVDMRAMLKRWTARAEKFVAGL